MATRSVTRKYAGFAQDSEAVAWEKVECIFDTILGQSTRSLPKYPGSLDMIYAGWIDGDGVSYSAEHLDEIKVAYNDFATYEISFGRLNVPSCKFVYWPARAFASFEMNSGDETKMEAIITTISDIFPVQEKHNKVFVVHGHDEGARESVARFLEKAGLEPVILHEQASHGKTLIEKLGYYSQVRFALVLLTPDDLGGKNESTLKSRARQNVVLELGYFLGRLGRSKVRALYKGDMELPSDVMGVEYIPMNDDSWKLKLARELEASGFKVDRKAL